MSLSVAIVHPRQTISIAIAISTFLLLGSSLFKHIPPMAALATIALTLGLIAYPAALHPAADETDLSYLCRQQPVNITATVLRIEAQQQRWRMNVAIEQIEQQRQTAKVRGTLRVQVAKQQCGHSESIHPPTTILPGDRIVFRSKLRLPRSFGLPAEFNYPRYLARSGIYTSAYVANSDSIVRLPNNQSPTWRTRIERWRTQLGRQIEQHFTPQQSAYLLSLTLGQKSRLSTQQRDQLSTFGISHLFSISGLHLGLIAGLLYQGINWLYRRSDRLLLWLPAQTATPILVLPLLCFYLMLSGGALPTLRATLLITVTLIAIIIQRHTPPVTLLALVAFIILAFDPLALFSASFQLSFAGVSALLLCLPPIQKHCTTTLQRWTILPLFATLTATIATTPIALWHFHTLAPAGVLCNLFAIPLIGMLTVPLALLGVVIFPVLPDLALIPLKLSLAIINLTLQLSSYITRGILTGRNLYLCPMEHIIIAVACFALLSLCAFKWRQSGVLVLASGILWLALLCKPAPPPLELTPFSIGQGDSLLLRLADQGTYLIDGGGLYSKTFDVGQRLLAPALGHIGVKHFDAVILSHDHPDHRKGLIYILEHFYVDQFWHSIPIRELHWRLQQVLKQRQIPMQKFSAGWTTLPTTDCTTLKVYVPPDQTAGMNDRSLVVYAGYGDDGILLTGDLEQHGVEQLLNQPLPGPVSLLKLPHHGSRRSLPEDLLQAAQPRIAIANVGYGNHYGFPHEEVIAAVKSHDVQLLRTDYDGTVRLSSFGKGWIKTTLDQP
ncbi:MAG: DNA internalization-related competence protein ComEC/Rec2 [Thermodesulfobacteriota bacterium]|nr:DNA internalization-related competence protein ComEC/Rec2 [Thermodesulfobacteriota bacterium]